MSWLLLRRMQEWQKRRLVQLINFRSKINVESKEPKINQRTKSVKESNQQPTLQPRSYKDLAQLRSFNCWSLNFTDSSDLCQDKHDICC